MKHLKYLLVALGLVSLGACSKSNEPQQADKQEQNQSQGQKQGQSQEQGQGQSQEQGTENEEKAKLQFDIRDNIVYGVGQLEANSHIEVPEGVTEIAESAFASRKEIKSISFPNTLTKIGKKAFVNCSKLEQVQLPKSLKSIESEAFSGSGLKEVSLPSELESVGSMAFALCSDMKTLSFGNKVMWHRDAFSFSQNLDKIYAHVEEPPMEKWSFLNSFFGTLYVPKASLEKYEEKYQYVNFKIEAIK